MRERASGEDLTASQTRRDSRGQAQAAVAGGGGGDEKVEKRLPEIRVALVRAEKEALYFYTHRSASVKGSLTASVL